MKSEKENNLSQVLEFTLREEITAPCLLLVGLCITCESVGLPTRERESTGMTTHANHITWPGTGSGT